MNCVYYGSKFKIKKKNFFGGVGGGGAEEGARVSELFFTKNLDVKKKNFFWVGWVWGEGGGRG